MNLGMINVKRYIFENLLLSIKTYILIGILGGLLRKCLMVEER